MSDSLLGTTCGNYRILDVLGEGGMGTVYRAIHPDLDRTVAIKVLALGLANSSDVVRRFRVEARAVNRIRHPNVVDIQDFGTLPDGRPYYVMEYLAGESLGHYLTRIGRIPPRDCLVIMLPITEALEAAHNAGVVHRDLKPDNIFLLARDGAPPTPKLLDFGIAKVLSETISGGNSRTQSGAVMGTPLYMSPEQAGGRVEELGTPSDIYSLGVILYQMLSGTTPFDSPGMGELLVMHMIEQPPPLSSRVAGVPAVLEELVMRMLAKAPAARPNNATAIRAELTAIASSLDINTSNPLERSPFAPTIMASGASGSLGGVAAWASGASGTAPPASRPPGMTSPSAMVGQVAPTGPTMRTRSHAGIVAAGVAVVVIAAVAIGFVVTRKDGSQSGQPAASIADAAASAVMGIDSMALPDAAVPDAPLPDAALRDAPAQDALPETELERRLTTAKKLFDEGLINRQEYDSRRKKILEELLNK